MGLYIGNTRIQEVKLGNQTISAIYAGTNKIFPDEYVLSSYTFTVNETYVSLNNSGGGYRIYVTSNRTNTEGVQSYVEYEIKSHPSEVEVFKYDDSFSLKTTAASLSSNTVVLRQKYSNKEISIYVTIAQQDEGYVDYKQLTEDGVYLLRGDYKAIKPANFLAKGYNIEAISAILVKDRRASFLLSKWSFNRWYDKSYYASHLGIYNQVYTPPNIGVMLYASSLQNDYEIENNSSEIIRLSQPSPYMTTVGNYLFGYYCMPKYAASNSLFLNNVYKIGRLPSGGYVNIIFDWYKDIKYIYDTWLPDDCPILKNNYPIWTSTLYENEKKSNGVGGYFWSIKAWAANLAEKQFYQPEDGTYLHYIEVYPIDL